MLGAILAIIFIILAFMFCIWCILRMAGYQSRLEEEYRIRREKEKDKKKKAKK